MQNTDSLRQYSISKILLIWFAAALPMPILAFWLAPLLALEMDLHLGITIWALMILGMTWQFVLSVLLLRADSRVERHSNWSSRLWLQSPQDPRTGKPCLRLLWWVLLGIVGTALIEQTSLADLLAVPLLWLAPWLAQVPAPDLAELARPEFVGAWWLIPMALVSCLFNYVLGEELLFRGVLLPRMRGAFGCWDWVANAVLFGAYHLIRPISIPSIVLATMLWTLPASRYRCAWFALIPHGIEGVFVLVMVVGLVMGALV
jgi:membrane protease YdiL (CAAX protease family)